MGLTWRNVLVQISFIEVESVYTYKRYPILSRNIKLLSISDLVHVLNAITSA
jgi:hypothetical protein